MKHAVPDAAACGPGPAPAPMELSGLSNISLFLTTGQEGVKNGRGLWRPWLSSTNDTLKQVRTLMDLTISGATCAEVTKVSTEFHHPVRLFWPRSHSFDYLYEYGEILLQNFPVQATINLYEDLDTEEEDEDEK